MNLVFRILWLDDTKEFYDSLDLDPLKDLIRSWGFKAEMELATTTDDFMSKKPWDKYDLIVVDYNLESDEVHGQDFIKRVRDGSIYTDIVFYTANPSSDLWEAIHQRQLEGVFVANRQVLLEKLEAVAQQVVRKVLDLNNMRGIVMAEVGDIDHILDSILTVGLAHLEEKDRDDIYQGFHRGSVKQAESQLEKLKLFNDKADSNSMAKLSDSYKRWLNFKRLKKVHTIVNKFEPGDYNKDVLTPRNFLAHGQPQDIAGGYLFRWGDKEYSFDEKESLSLRKKILDYKDLFQEIYDQLSTNAA